jgi:hypothetical protein
VSIHITSDPSLRRPGYVYRDGMGSPMEAQPSINWNHIDGPLLYCSDGQLHWLTWRDRIRLHWKWADIHDIDFERRSK